MPGDTIPTTPAGWPYLDQDNYLDLTPEYTEQLADKLQNSDADVAAAINAATRAENAAATAVAAAARMAAGKVTVTPSAPNTPTSLAITFPAGRFTAPPAVVVTADTTSPGTQVVAVAVSSVTTGGCVIIVNRVNTTPTGCFWIAIQP